VRTYLAARYSRREELCRYREQLRSIGYNVQARWLDGGHQLSTDGTPIGDRGEKLVEGAHGDLLTEIRAASLRMKFATDDFDDVLAAKLVISFTEPPRSNHSRGGRHVEFGIALANRARVCIVGHRENIFHWLPGVVFYPRWEDLLSDLKPHAQ
jgi:hypothetical protein